MDDPLTGTYRIGASEAATAGTPIRVEARWDLPRSGSHRGRRLGRPERCGRLRLAGQDGFIAGAVDGHGDSITETATSG